MRQAHRCLLWLAALCGGCLLACGALAQPVLEVGAQPSYPLSRAFSYFDDETTQRSLQQVLESAQQARFIPVVQVESSTNFGASRSAIWLKVQLQLAAGAPTLWMLEVANPALDHLDVYVSNASGSYDHQTGGDLLPFAQRPVPHRNHVKPITLLPGAVSTVYLRIQSLGTVSAPTTLWQPAALWQHDQQTYSIFSLYFGLLAGLLIYNLLLYLPVRDPAYLVYGGFVIFMGLSQAANSGLAAQFLWPAATWWNNNAINACNAASGTFGVWFARRFLASAVTMPRLDYWLRLLVLLWASAFPVALLLPYRVAVAMVTGLALVGVVMVVSAGVLAIRRRHPGAPYFGLAWGALLTGVLVLTLHNNGLVPSNVFTANALLIGSSLEMVLLSFALADRINTARRAKELAESRMMAEQARGLALQQSQADYRAVIEHVGEGMVVLKDDRIVFVNARASEILEARAEDIVSRGVADQLHEEDRARIVERIRARQAGQPLAGRSQARLMLPGRPLKWLEVGDATVPWDGAQAMLLFFLDVTERHQAEQDTRTALQRQQELNDLRSRFVAMTSHEFRTPLATILSSQDLLKHYHDRLPEGERADLLAIIESGVHRMTRMLDRVLLLGKAEAHMLEFQPRAIDLHALCAGLVEEARSSAPDSSCVLQLDWVAAGPGQRYDDKLLGHIFGNLLSNALKYSPAGGLVVLRVTAEGAQTVFEVSDQGIGIPVEEVGHLFESFHRASNVGEIRGTGLGLAIVKNAVDLHGGTISVHSAPGQGSRFTVRLG